MDGYQAGDPRIRPTDPSAATRPAELPAEVDVLIAGCGPAGLVLAAQLAEFPSITTRIVEWEWPVIRCEILVERESQKGIVIGHKGAVLKRVGTAVRRQLPEGAYLELQVKVDKDWQRRDAALDRLGF